MWAALFPGQGSQSIGMGKFLFDNFAVARDTFEEASDTLSIDFKKLCFEGPESELNLTENTQPALLLISNTVFRVVASTVGIRITAAAGHSIGEYAALVTSGALNFADGLRAVQLRGRAMQKAVPVGQGGMVAVMGMNDSQVEQLCHWAESSSGEKPLQSANFNAPGQVVISGSQKAIDWLLTNGKSEAFNAATNQTEPVRLKMKALAVSAPFHCSLMKPAEDKMRSVLGEIHFKDAQWPIVQNVSAVAVTDADQLRENLINQVSSTVRWTQCMAEIKKLGCTHRVEFGPGRVLTGLAKKIDSTALPPFNINDLEELKKLESVIKENQKEATG